MLNKITVSVVCILLLYGCTAEEGKPGESLVDTFSVSTDEIPDLGTAIILSAIITYKSSGKQEFGPVIIEKAQGDLGQKAKLTSKIEDMSKGILSYECLGVPLSMGTVYEFYDNKVHLIGALDYAQIKSPLTGGVLKNEVVRIMRSRSEKK